MEKEVIFARTLEEVRKTAKEQGNCITSEQVEEAFAPLNLEKEQLNLVYDFLTKHKIGIDEEVNREDYLSEEEKNYLEMYLEDLQALETVTEGQKEGITLSAMAGDRTAQHRLVEIYLPQVVDLAKLYGGQGVVIEDLIGEGNVALAMGVSMLGCLEKASEAQGMLGKMIMDAMEEYIAENAEEGKKDRHVLEKVNKVAEAAKNMAEDLGRKVTARELAEESGMSLKSIQDAMRISGFKIEDLENGE